MPQKTREARDITRAPVRASAKSTPRPPGRGVDVSQWQGRIDWQKVARSGVSFSYVKASEGLGRDQRFTENARGAKAAGLQVGAYHYYHPNQDPISQARNFSARIMAVGAIDLPPAVDVEESAAISPAAYSAGLRTMLGEVNRLTGVKPTIYTSPGFFNSNLKDPELIREYGVWGAAWGPNAPTIGGVKPSVWQYSSKGKIPGINTPVDLNLSLGPTTSAETVNPPAAVPAGQVVESAFAPQSSRGAVQPAAMPTSGSVVTTRGQIASQGLPNSAQPPTPAKPPADALASAIGTGISGALADSVSAYAKQTGLDKLTVVNVAGFGVGLLLLVIGFIWAIAKTGKNMGQSFNTSSQNLSDSEQEAAERLAKFSATLQKGIPAA